MSDKLDSLNIMNEISIFLMDTFGEDYDHKLIMDSNSNTLYAKEFFVLYSFIDNKYSLSFQVGIPPSDAAKICCVISNVLNLNEIELLTEFFYSVEENQFYFGDNALELKKAAILKSYGKVKCNICDYVFPESQIKEGICISCFNSLNTINWQ